MTLLIPLIPELTAGASAADTFAKDMTLSEVDSLVENSLAVEKVYSYLTTAPTLEQDKATVINWATYMKEKYSGAQISNTYLSNSDIIFTTELYNSLCNNISQTFKNYLVQGGGLDADIKLFEVLYLLLVNDFNGKVNENLQNLDSIYNQNRCLTIGNNSCFKIILKNGALTATSPALIADKNIDINFTLPTNLLAYYSAMANTNLCKVNIQYLGQPTNPAVLAANKKIHRIREVE